MNPRESEELVLRFLLFYLKGLRIMMFQLCGSYCIMHWKDLESLVMICCAFGPAHTAHCLKETGAGAAAFRQA